MTIKGLVDFCRCTPYVWARPKTLTSIVRGFLDNGTIDNALKIRPIWENMINTMPRKISNTETLMSKDCDIF